MRKIFAIVLPVILLAACHLPLSIPDKIPPTANSRNCYYNWTSQPLPDLSEKVQAAINAAGLGGVSATAEAYGENCIDPMTNQQVSFATMETDFHITAEVNGLANRDDLGNLLEKILVVLDTFPAGKIPGPQPGSISVSFRHGNEELNLLFSVKEWNSARLQGLHGEDLLARMQNK